uniref:Uncharacterized protein n=1 Tax=Oryza brachyantha TaxID=4533 RepID=J3LWK2_ORYBR
MEGRSLVMMQGRTTAPQLTRSAQAGRRRDAEEKNGRMRGGAPVLGRRKGERGGGELAGRLWRGVGREGRGAGRADGED